MEQNTGSDKCRRRNFQTNYSINKWVSLFFEQPLRMPCPYVDKPSTRSSLSYKALSTLCTPTLPTSSLLSTYGLMSPLSQAPPPLTPTPAPPFPLSLSLSASGPITKRFPISVNTSKLGSKLGSSSQDLSSSLYLLMSFVTMIPPVAFTENFLKCSRSRVRNVVASSVRNAVRLCEGERAVRARLWIRVKNWKMDRQV